MLPSKTRMVSRAEDSSQMINTLRNCRTISTRTYRGLEASIEHLGSMVADRIWRWVQRAIRKRPVFWQRKDLRNIRIGARHGAVAVFGGSPYGGGVYPRPGAVCGAFLTSIFQLPWPRRCRTCGRR